MIAGVEDLEQDLAERVDIAGFRGPAGELLRRGVARRSADRLHLGIELDREPPVDDVDLAELAHHDVLGLEIAMHDLLRVGVVDRHADARQRG